MVATLPINEMTISEKISTRELLWDDICRNTPDFTSPSWHGKILKEREKNLKEGKDKFLDWEEAKKNIWSSVS